MGNNKKPSIERILRGYLGEEVDACEFENVRKPNGYWTLERTLEECKKLVDRKGNLPTQRQMFEIGRSNLVKAIAINGGFHRMRLKLGLEYSAPERPKNYWSNLDNVKKELAELESRLGHTPTGPEIRSELPTLYGAIQKYYGGIRQVRDILGIPLERKEDGYWDDWKNVKREIERVKQENNLDRLPSHQELLRLGETTLPAGIKSQGGYSAVRSKLGEEDRKRPRGYWKKWGNFKQELEQAISEIGHFPTQRELIENEYGAIASSTDYYGGLQKIRKRLGAPAKEKRRGHWQEWGNIEGELKKVIKEND